MADHHGKDGLEDEEGGGRALRQGWARGFFFFFFGFSMKSDFWSVDIRY